MNSRTIPTIPVQPFGMAAVLACFLALALLLPLPAVGVTACGGVLRDADGLIPEGQSEQVEQLTDATKLGGALPLIVLVNEGEGALLDRELEQAIATCPALEEDRAHVVAIGIVVADRTVRVQAGSAIAPRISHDAIAARMREQIGTMPVEQILAGAFSEINTQLYDTRSQTNTNPLLSPAVLSVLSVLAILILVVSALWLYTNRKVFRRTKAHIDQLRQRGMAVAEDLERDQRTISQLTQTLTGRLTLLEAEPLRRAQVESQLRTRVVLRRWHGLINQLGTAEGLRTKTLEQVGQPLAEGLNALQQALDHTVTVHGQIAHVLSVIDGIDQHVDQLATLEAQVNTQIAQAEANGWVMDEAKVLSADAHAYVGLAHQRVQEQAMLAADEHLRIAEHKWLAAQELAEARRMSQTDLGHSRDVLQARYRELLAALGPAQTAMAGLVASFAPNSWEAVAGHLPLAQTLLIEAGAALESIQLTGAQPVETGGHQPGGDGVTQLEPGANAEHTGADGSLEQVNATLDVVGAKLDRAESLIDAIHECLAGLQHDSLLLPDALRSVDKAVAMAIQISTAREQDEGIAELTAARDRIHREAQHRQPDLRALINWAELIQLQADQWVALQRDDDALDRHFTQAARSTLEQARKCCEYAASVVYTNGHLIPDTYVQVVEELTENVNAAMTIDDPFTQMDIAAKIRHQACAIEQDARRVVKSQIALSPTPTPNP